MAENIMDLPPEILGKVMSHLSGQEYRQTENRIFSSSPSEDIKNVRLTNRILSQIASRYLIEHITVDVSQRSLARLEEISQHPHISRGVRGVEFCLEQYDDAFNGGVQGFMDFIQHHRRDLAFPWLRPQQLALKALAIEQAWGVFHARLDAYADTMPGSFDDEINSIRILKDLLILDSGINGALLDGYSRYRNHLHEQTSLQQGAFMTRVSNSMARLLCARHIRITDSDLLHLPIHQPGGFNAARRQLDISTDNTIVESLSKARRPFKDIQGNTLVNMIPGLVCTASTLKSLSIQVSPNAGTYTQLSLSIPQQLHLNSSLKNLRFFKFENDAIRRGNTGNVALGGQALGRFIDACLVSEDLEHVSIHANLHGMDLPPTASLFHPNQWPKLKSVSLAALPASANDIAILAESLSTQPERKMSMFAVHLYCGATWASILDVLRQRRIRVRLGNQRGAEFDDDPLIGEEVFAENYRDITGVTIGPYPSFAEYYVHGEDMPNPILSRPDEEIRERLLGPVDRF
jgi:hypothetical protein